MFLRRHEKLIVELEMQLCACDKDDRRASGALNRDYYAMTRDSCEAGGGGAGICVTLLI